MVQSTNSIEQHLLAYSYKWVVTGCAGFIGSHLLEKLLTLNQKVTGLDNFSTGKRANLDDVRSKVSGEQWSNFSFVEGDITDYGTCEKIIKNCRYVLHQAALGSVPRSIENPMRTNESNITGFLNMIHASKDAGVTRFVYAASSSTYGDHPALPKKEENIGKPLSPYAVTKYVNELYADVFARTYQLKSVGLRYFNVFGPRQDPQGAYAAVIPKWIAAMLTPGKEIQVYGDGETSRDFCYIDNVVQANLLAALGDDESANQVYNIALGDRTTLTQLFELIKRNVVSKSPAAAEKKPKYVDFRPGDVRHSQADVSKAMRLLGYQPQVRIEDGIARTCSWFLRN